MIRLVVGLLLLFTGTTFAAGNVLLVTDLEDDHFAYRPDLGLAASKALNPLQNYEVGRIDRASPDVQPDGTIRYNFNDQVDTPAPLDDNVGYLLERGYLLGAIEEKEGVNISLSVKLGLDALF